jgi:hypothetical protein
MMATADGLTLGQDGRPAGAVPTAQRSFTPGDTGRAIS